MSIRARQENVVKILNGIQQFTKAEDDDLKELLADFPEVAFLVKQINGFEKKLAKMLKEERKRFVQAIQMYLQDTSTENVLVSAMLEFTISDVLSVSTFATTLSEEAKAFLNVTVSELTSKIMEAIDKDVPFEVLSKVSVDWIDNWSTELGRLMNLTNVNAVERAIRETIENGESIQKLVMKLQELPEFSRKRARATAITETLTASSVAQFESYQQSPSVTAKTWLHSGMKRIKARPHHVALSGTTIPLDEQFLVGSEYADYPRATNLSPGERVNCHCALAPYIDESILGLSVEERKLIREQTLQQLGKV